jgi:hypothetical protein
MMIDENELTTADGLGELHPIMRASGAPKGETLTVNGQAWLLAHGGAASILDAYRDRMDDQVRMSGQVDMSDVYEVGRLMLASNYELTEEEVLELLASADPGDLVKAVMASLFGKAKVHRQYTMWMMASLYANGLDPEKIPAEWMPHVLDMLVSTGRTLPINKYTDAAIAAPQLAQMRAAVTATAAAKAAAAPVEPPAPPEATS